MPPNLLFTVLNPNTAAYQGMCLQVDFLEIKIVLSTGT